MVSNEESILLILIIAYCECQWWDDKLYQYVNLREEEKTSNCYAKELVPQTGTKYAWQS